MNFATLLVALAMAVTTAHAAECTAMEISSLAVKPEFLTLAISCAGVTVDPTKPDAVNAKKVCESSSCVAALESAAKAFPKCDYQGAAFSAGFDKVVAECKKAGGGSSTSSGAATAAPASAATGAIAVAAAVVAYARV